MITNKKDTMKHEPSKTYLLIYLLVIVIFSVVFLLIDYLLFDKPVSITATRAIKVTENFNSALKAGCATLIANVESPNGSSVIKQLYRPDGQGVANCREILIS